MGLYLLGFCSLPGSGLLCKIFKELEGLATGSANPGKGTRCMLTLKRLPGLMAMGRVLITLGKALSKGENNTGFADKHRVTKH